MSDEDSEPDDIGYVLTCLLGSVLFQLPYPVFEASDRNLDKA